MDLPAHTRDRIDEIRATHLPVRVWIRTRRWWWRCIDVCLLCREPYECRQRRWVDDVLTGRRQPAGWRP
jgi:hypothetical protein